jgi:TolA-binding protein
MAVRAGQHLSVNGRSKEVLLQQFEQPNDHAEEQNEGSPGTSPAPFQGLGGAAGGGVGAPAPVRSARGPMGLGGGRGWAAALAAGDLDSILGDAERRGIRRAIAEANSEDLAALADAARYRRRNDIARRALLAERERFPHSSRASNSAFLLGRLEENKTGGETRALEWYDLYLKEAPFGAYSSEALGRKMTATERAMGAPAARQVAEEYLRRFPNGTYAGAARALRDGP